MNKAELIEKVRKEVPSLSRSQAESAVDCALDSMMKALLANERVSLFGFGAFVPSPRAPRTGRNPRTGETVRIPAGRAVRFTPSAAFKEALNPKAARKAASAKKASKAAATKATSKGGRTAAATKAAPAARKAPAKKAATSTKKR